MTSKFYDSERQLLEAKVEGLRNLLSRSRAVKDFELSISWEPRPEAIIKTDSPTGKLRKCLYDIGARKLSGERAYSDAAAPRPGFKKVLSIKLANTKKMNDANKLNTLIRINEIAAANNMGIELLKITDVPTPPWSYFGAHHRFIIGVK